VSLLLSLALLSLFPDGPLALRPGDKGYAEAASTVRAWVKLRDTEAKGDPSRLLICDWRAGKRLALVETPHKGFLHRAFYSEVGGRPVHTTFTADRMAFLDLDQPFVEAAFKTCAPLMANRKSR
jgi:hypothetical protein